MTKFLIEMAETWVHIICGMAFFGVLLVSAYLAYVAYNSRVESRDCSEMERLREAIRQK